MLRGPSRWTPPLAKRPDEQDRKPIMVHPDQIERLRNLLFEDDMQGVGYSEFLKRAIDFAALERRVNDETLYDEVLTEVAEDLLVAKDTLRQAMSDWLRATGHDLFEARRAGTPFVLDAECYALYRLVKQRSAFRMAQATIQRREAREKGIANALLDLMEIEGNECAHGHGAETDCPEPDCAWTPLRPFFAEAARLTGRQL